MSSSHQDYMQLALQLAERGRFTVSPNPMVGCVIVKNNQIIGQGFHQHAGKAHAELIALREAGTDAQGAILYVTLEPCCHDGKTPPCVNALIKSQIKKIYIACLDPNPLVAGKGIENLRAAGIKVELGLLADQAIKLNQIFFHYITHHRPFVIAKWAMSLDGKTTTHLNDTRDISSPASQMDAHELRKKVDAILIGSKTAIHDNPLLTIRYGADLNSHKHPIRIVLSTKGRLPLHLKLFDPALPAKTIIATTDMADQAWLKKAAKQQIEILMIPTNQHQQVDLFKFLNELGKREIASLLIEGGMTTHEQFMQANLINQLHVYLAPVMIGALEKKHILTNIDVKRHDSDFHFTANDQENRYV
ncbi:MAG: riboflavin biosynthesis protein RibD [Gammaproteobacteria bacterium RIFCSPHIGHO2_12_FULL_37_34]|nr:MAG: riboflavin biosynthesis protein RibD [Gammaproteobacteria bacterium RIFCSPHIGHO2_12_FULL_37_34]